MAWTWSGDPSLSDLDMVRFLAGDTDNTDQLVTDEIIQANLDRYGSPERAGAKVARGIAAKFAREFDKAVGDVRKSLSQKVSNYIKIAEDLESSLAAEADAVSRKRDQLANVYVW